MSHSFIKQDSVSPAFAAIDETFDVQLEQNYELLIEIEASNIRFAVVNSIQEKVIALLIYEPVTSKAEENAFQFALTLLPLLGWLSLNWKNVRIAIAGITSTMVPSALFSAENAGFYLQIASKMPTADFSIKHYVHSANIVTVFSLPETLFQSLNTTFTNTELIILPVLSTFMEGLELGGVTNPNKKIAVLVAEKTLHVVLTENGTVQFANTFHFTSPEDFIYYLLTVMQEHGLDNEKHQVTLWGEFIPGSAVHLITQKYIKHVKLGMQPVSLKYSYKIADQFAHRYFSLFSLHYCTAKKTTQLWNE